MVGAAAMLSVFVRNPEFQGQTKERLATADAQRMVEQAIKDPFDHWLSGNPPQAARLLEFVIERAEERLDAAQEKEVARKTAATQAAPARQARRLHRHRDRRHRAVHRRGRLAPAAGPSRRATARPRRSCRCAARSSTSPPPPRTSSRANAELADLMQALGVRHRRALPRRGPALRAHHHHDRRRRRRRPYRLAADHVLLPADAAS